METGNKVQNFSRTWKEKETIIGQWQQSGLSRKEFCDQHGISYNSLVSWCKTIKDKQAGKGFTEVKIPVVEPSGLFAQLHLPKGMRIDFFHFVPAEYFQAILK
jgi:transposase-like protein